MRPAWLRCRGPWRAGPVEVVVVDNFPADRTGGIVRRDYPWVDYVAPAANLGFGRANNLGYARSSGDYVLFLNPDTVVNEAALAHCVARLEADPAIGLISPRLVQGGRHDGPGLPPLGADVVGRLLSRHWARGAFPGRALFAGYNLTHLPPAAPTTWA